MFSNKATKIDRIFTVDLTFTSQHQIDGEDFVKFCGLLRKHELYQKYLNPLCTIILLNMYWTHLKTLCTRKRKICFDTVTHRHFWYVLQNCKQNGWTVMYMTSFKSKYLSTVNDEQQRVFKNSNEDPDFSIFFSAYDQAWTS